jgi:thymidine phosphorylase
MTAIVDAQGRREDWLQLGRLGFEVRSPATGYVTGIDNLLLARVARLAGAPMANGAGVDLFKKVGDRVQKGEPLYRVYSEFPSDRHFARALAGRSSGYLIGRRAEVARAFVEF